MDSLLNIPIYRMCYCQFYSTRFWNRLFQLGNEINKLNYLATNKPGYFSNICFEAGKFVTLRFFLYHEFAHTQSSSVIVSNLLQNSLFIFLFQKTCFKGLILIPVKLQIAKFHVDNKENLRFYSVLKHKDTYFQICSLWSCSISDRLVYKLCVSG